jgi:hypothetical protein
MSVPLISNERFIVSFTLSRHISNDNQKNYNEIIYDHKTKTQWSIVTAFERHFFLLINTIYISH